MQKPLSAETLRTALKDADEKLASNFQTIHDELTVQIQSRWCARWPGGNDHGPGHIERVLDNLARLLGPTPFNFISPLELYLAMVAIAAHDVGIIRGRDKHADASVEIIDKIASTNVFLFDSVWLPYLKIAISCHSHHANIDNACKKFPTVEPFARGHVHPKRLAGIVRLADELDEDYTRAKLWVQKAIEVPSESQPYWEFCQKITSIGIEGPGTDISFNVRFDAVDISREVQTEKGRLAFLNFFAGKLVKIHRERELMRKYIGDLAGKDLVITVTPNDPISGWEDARTVTLQKDKFVDEKEEEKAIAEFLRAFADLKQSLPQ